MIGFYGKFLKITPIKLVEAEAGGEFLNKKHSDRLVRNDFVCKMECIEFLEELGKGTYGYFSNYLTINPSVPKFLLQRSELMHEKTQQTQSRHKRNLSRQKQRTSSRRTK